MKLRLLFAILALLFLTSCQNIDDLKWTPISNPNDLKFDWVWDMAVDEKSNLWVAVPPQLVYVPPNGKILKFPFENDGPCSICAGEDAIGIITFEGKIVFLDSKNSPDISFVVLRENDRYQASHCIVLNDRSLLVWKNYWIETIYKDGTSSMYYIEQNKVIGDISVGESGRLQAVTKDGDILYKNDMHAWTLEDEPDLDLTSNEIAYLIRYIGNKVWIATSDSLFTFDTGFTNGQIVLSKDTIGVEKFRIFDVFQANRDIIITSTNGVWRAVQEENNSNITLEQLADWLPFSLSAAYDPKLGRIYIAVDKGQEGIGIYYLNVLGMP